MKLIRLAFFPLAQTDVAICKFMTFNYFSYKLSNNSNFPNLNFIAIDKIKTSG